MCLLRMLYYLTMGKKLHLDDPKTMNEKLQWLKINQRDPLLTTLVDKLTVKDYVSEKIGAEFVCPLLGVWDSFDEIDFSALPDQFVLKTNHSGGNTGVVICQDKSSLDIPKAREKLTNSLNTDIFPRFREWPYKNIQRKVFAEEFIEDKGRGELLDYKFYCFNGFSYLFF